MTRLVLGNYARGVGNWRPFISIGNTIPISDAPRRSAVEGGRAHEGKKGRPNEKRERWSHCGSGPEIARRKGKGKRSAPGGGNIVYALKVVLPES